MALTYWVSVAGIAITIEPSTSSRAVGVTAIVCALAAIGLDGIVQTGISFWPRRRLAVSVLAAAIVAITGVAGLHRFFRSPDHFEVSSDLNTEVVEHLARSLATMPPGTTVYFGGAPRIWYGGFSNFAFRAPLATGVDLDPPLDGDTDAPTITGPTLFAFIPERRSELDIVRSWFPEGLTTDVIDARGVELYSSYLVTP